MKKVKLCEIGKIITGCTPSTKKEEYYSNNDFMFVGPSDIKSVMYVDSTEKHISTVAFNEYKNKFINENSIVVDCIGSDMGNVAIIKNKCLTNQQINAITNINCNDYNIKYIYYVLSTMKQYFHLIGTNGSTMPILNKTMFENLEIEVPEKEIQDKIANILSKLDDKIKLNNEINNNLDEQLRILFNNNFFDNIEKNNIDNYSKLTLYDVLDVIDNRGKTPQLVEYSDYPIIDVRAISGEGRIIDYKKCQKYVDEEVYNTFFRSGHPIINDIIISTVGSLAEMKIYKKNKGTIAQNVIGLRAKTNYPMYIYQYLKAIKNDLILYNIGSVQPSIKVTQFMKHSIYIPNDKELHKFENLAQIYTDKMFNISKENETLVQLRDTLLPKLMNGEIDLDKIEI